MASLNNLIRVYDNALSSETCHSLIDIFESNKDKQEKIDTNQKPSFTQFNLTENSNEFKPIHNHVIKNTFEYTEKYYDFVCKEVFPESHAFEQFRIKKYLPDGHDMFDTHVDVRDYSSARRFLTLMWYLNDVDEGGETEFESLQIKPKQGKLVVFPPLWMFPHRGNPPISSAKYLLHTYLHYK